MPLHEDDPSAEGNLSDEEYTAKVAEVAAAGKAAGDPVCDSAPPADVVAAAVARLDASNG